MTCTPTAPDSELPTTVQPNRSIVADVLAQLGELDVAQEKLRVADEALREYEGQLAELVIRNQAEQRWRDRMAELVPVCQLVTDVEGNVQEADVATGQLLGTPVARLIGKPLAAFLAPDRHAELRAALSGLGSGSLEQHLLLPVRVGDGAEASVHTVAVREPGEPDDRIRWVLVSSPVPGSPPADGGDDLDIATAVAQLFRVPVGVADQQVVLGQLASIVRESLGSADTASITLGSPVDPHRLASDSVEAQQLDGLMFKVGEGPCVSAYESGQIVCSDDLLADQRFPRLAALAGTVGVRSVLGLPISAGDRRLGVLNVYATDPHAFGDRDRRVGALVASAVGAVLEQIAQQESLRSLTGHLEQAMSSRAVIEQAKGIVMAHHGGTPDEAFARLVSLSNSHNIKLRDLATVIVDGGSGDRLQRLTDAG